MKRNPTYVNNEIRKCLVKGKETEFMVGESLVKYCGGTFEIASFEEDTKRHIDLWWESPKKGRIGIDVKGVKKLKRSDNETDDSMHWIEIRNTQGKKGWIYGDMEYIAFVTNHDILFVKPKELYGNILFNTIGKNLLHENINLELYSPYQRKDRKDVIIKIPTSELREISHFSISKYEPNV